ncbi:hypothetical protein roselon_02430 [Roseibacterium elongatum DSM 19469]|uniref:Uncharacterized protein n=2 Tax=Roseicyclus elongatus TaxID=159346 RepID=W8SQD3_9RHOB|nr:hypothetical protein roselon_02430 [Roseibacterium elongatum DSM 19469]
MALLPTGPAPAEPVACPDGRTSVEGAGATAPVICDIVAAGRREIAQCGGLDLSRPIEIAINPDLGLHCVGQYHCGENRIELLPPDTYLEGTAMSANSAFATIAPDAYFASIIRHELAHAAMDTMMDCPFEHCLVGQEYVAYTLQIEFLPGPERDAFLAGLPEVTRPVSRDELTPMTLFMAPGIFAQKAWLHFSARPDPCGFLGQVARGTVLLDQDRF